MFIRSVFEVLAINKQLLPGTLLVNAVALF